MEICSRRHFLLIICIWQLVTIVERQVFDFLGYLWVPILVNFFHIIFVIFGFFGSFQYRPKYIITYVVWCFLWIGWNIFLICFYLSAGSLEKDSEILNLGTGSVSWFEVNGYGCKPVFPTNLTSESSDPFRPIRPEKVTNCVLDYEYVEVLHSGIQCALAMLGGVAGILLSQIFLEEDDSSQVNKLKNKGTINRNTLYSIEYRHNEDSREDEQQIAPRPMTPRRVKRRSETARNSVRHHNRNSIRSSQRRRQIQNPVTRLIEQQQQQLSLGLQSSRVTNLDTSSDYDPNCSSVNLGNPSYAITNHSYRLQTPFLSLNPTIAAINQEVIETNTGLCGSNHKANSDKSNLHFHEQNFNIRLSNFDDDLAIEDSTGHTNPTYQQSSMQSLNEEDMYNNRPGSARSSYSNYHGTRTISHLNQPDRPMPILNQAFARSISEVQDSSRAISYVDKGGVKQMYFQGQATAQVPTNHRRSSRRLGSTFIQAGPPAYNVQGVIDSETVI